MRGFMEDRAQLFEGTRGINLPVFPEGSTVSHIPVQDILASWIDGVMMVNVQPDAYPDHLNHHPYHHPTELVLPPAGEHTFRFVRSFKTTEVLGVDVNLDTRSLQSAGSRSLKTATKHVRAIDAMPDTPSENFSRLFEFDEIHRPGYDGSRAALMGEPLRGDFKSDRAVQKHNKAILPVVREILETLGYSVDSATNLTFTYKQYRQQMYDKFNTES